MTAKRFFSFSLLGLSLLGGALYQLAHSEEPIFIESIESKTDKGEPVFNQISFQAGKTLDIWKMKQSHKGRNLPLHSWDQIQITVNKTKKPYEVSYDQFVDGKEIELKASCFTCHANGPRNIRPKLFSKTAPLSFKQKAIIGLWNLRMKSYGKMEIKIENYRLAGDYRKIPLRYFGEQDAAKLQVKTCLKCHNKDSFWGRGELERQHSGSIQHLVTKGEMPPWPFKLSAKEKRDLEAFTKGF